MCLIALALSGIILVPINFLVESSPSATVLLRFGSVLRVVIAAMLFIPKIYVIATKPSIDGDTMATGGDVGKKDNGVRLRGKSEVDLRTRLESLHTELPQ